MSYELRVENYELSAVPMNNYELIIARVKNLTS